MEKITVVSGMTYSVEIHLPEHEAKEIIKDIEISVNDVINNHYQDTKKNKAALYESLCSAAWKITAKNFAPYVKFTAIKKEG